MTCHAAVCVGDDLAAGQPSVAERAPDHEAPGGIDEDVRLLVDGEIAVDRRPHDVFEHVIVDHAMIVTVGVLGGDHDGIDADRFVPVVLHRDLGFAVRPQEVDDFVLARRRERVRDAVRDDDGDRHQLFGFAAREAEHHALVARSDGGERFGGALLHLERLIDAERDVRRLFVDRDRDAARIGVKAEARIGIADLAHGVADDLWYVDVARCGDLAGYVHLTRDDERLARDATHRILRENGVEHRVGDLIRDLVRVTLGHAFRCERSFIRHATFPRSTRQDTSAARVSACRSSPRAPRA